jgi:hypothetical protein
MGGCPATRIERGQTGSFYGPFFRLHPYLELDALRPTG